MPCPLCSSASTRRVAGNRRRARIPPSSELRTDSEGYVTGTTIVETVDDIECADCGCRAPEDEWDNRPEMEVLHEAMFLLGERARPQVISAIRSAIRNYDEIKELARQLGKEREKTLTLKKAVVDWWREGRPLGWTRGQHLADPKANTTTEAEERLAAAAAEEERRR